MSLPPASDPLIRDANEEIRTDGEEHVCEDGAAVMERLQIPRQYTRDEHEYERERRIFELGLAVRHEPAQNVSRIVVVVIKIAPHVEQGGADQHESGEERHQKDVDALVLQKDYGLLPDICSVP